MKIFLRDPATWECHIVTIHESEQRIVDMVLDQFNLSRSVIIPESEYMPPKNIESYELADPRDYSKIIGTLETQSLDI